MNAERTQFIIDNLRENLEIEVKNWLGGISDNEAKAKLAKEIIALANNGGGQIFIGFEDNVEGHPEIEPNAGELEAFSQDNISSIVNRYVDPPFQCEVKYYTRTGGHINHPVIDVPGLHRTPVYAKRDSPDSRTLKTGTVYLRRPGGQSEPARNQNDWEHLLDRLVRSRQDEQLAAIREIMNPSIVANEEKETNLKDWENESILSWQSIIAGLTEDDPRRFQAGCFSFSFHIENFSASTMIEIRDYIYLEIPRFSGWPPFTYLNNPDMSPTIQNKVIQAWLKDGYDGHWHSDFWRISKDGYGYLLRPMQEDHPSYRSNITPRPTPPYFDWTLPIYRATEFLKYVENLALKFSDANSRINVRLHYYNTSNRSLQAQTLDFLLREGQRCVSPQILSDMSTTAAEIGINLEEKVYIWLSPIYEQFDFTDLPKGLVNRIVSQALGYRR